MGSDRIESVTRPRGSWCALGAATKSSFTARLESQCFVYHSTYRYIRNEGKEEYAKALENYRKGISSGNLQPHSPHRLLADQLDPIAYAFEEKGLDYYEASRWYGAGAAVFAGHSFPPSATSMFKSTWWLRVGLFRRLDRWIIDYFS